MTSSRAVLSAVILALFLGAVSNTKAVDLPSGANLLDPECIFYSWPYPTISPDGQWVAYVSKGFVCVCNIKAPAPRKIMEVPYSWTWPHFLVKQGDSSLTGSISEFRGLSRDERRELHGQLTNSIHGLTWTHDSSGFVFGVQSYDAKQKAATSDVYFASVDGKRAMLMHAPPDSLTRSLLTGTLTRDRKSLVGSPYQMAHRDYRPLIWDVKNNKPRATCFLYLTPSSTSDRWIGIEKDTRQLVITDEQFEVIKRFNEIIPERTFGFRLDWSPDERFIIWRNQIGFDHYNNWEGFHMDIDTGAKRKLDGRFMDELIAFTGRGGEFYRFGSDGVPSQFISGDRVTGAHLTIVPQDQRAPLDVWRIKVDPNRPTQRLLTNIPGNPPLRMSPDGNLFAIALPRPTNERPGCVWHLIDRKGRTWRFPGADSGEYVSPYELAGFADNDRMIVGYDSSRLFALPVSTIMTAANEIK